MKEHAAQASQAAQAAQAAPGTAVSAALDAAPDASAETTDKSAVTPASDQCHGAGAAAIGVAIALGGAYVAGEFVRGSIGALRPQVMQRYTLDSADEVEERVDERMIEYERKVPFKGFSARHLFPNEPKFKRGDGHDLALASKEDLMLPAGWRWKEDWVVVTGAVANARGTDKDGWMYAFNWGSEYSASAKMSHCVRRRIWQRTRERVAG